MFVQSKTTTLHRQRNGVAIRQRRGERETLVQWQNGEHRWVSTEDLVGTVRLIGSDAADGYDYE